jgi:hypothetical protein
VSLLEIVGSNIPKGFNIEFNNTASIMLSLVLDVKKNNFHMNKVPRDRTDSPSSTVRILTYIDVCHDSPRHNMTTQFLGILGDEQYDKS